jgi:subtilisin family serine protease
MPRCSAALRLALVALVVVAAAPALQGGVRAQDQTAAAKRYVVVFKPSVADAGAAAGDLAARLGFRTDHVYRAALKGFAAQLPQAAADRLRGDPRVALVEEDREVKLHADILPTGVDRIGADIGGRLPTQPGAPVAVIDSGVDTDHPDLNVVGGFSCLRGDYDDDHGHGTHVAGIVGAKDNGRGVVGVAPGTPLYAVRVFNASGVTYTAIIICGLDWVAANARAKGIKVANVSIGGAANAKDQQACGNGTTAYHEAFCGLKRTGVTVVVAAGNENDNAANYVPATYPEVVTVSALADSDGCTGGQGPPIAYPWGTRDPDDTRAEFSNFGADVDVAAPGSNILSTLPKEARGGLTDPSGYGRVSGTSMAAPHVAGTIALNIKRGRGATWAEEAGVLPEGVVKVSNAINCNDGTPSQ